MSDKSLKAAIMVPMVNILSCYEFVVYITPASIISKTLD